MNPDPFIQLVIEQLKNRHSELSLRKISRETGLTFQWISLFLNKKIKNPGYTRIKKLHDYLSSCKFHY